ncbi:tripartite motif-containing protein 3-like [Saccostrea cucullata]|uniref:tripartite motif-containing protein 3-like n=1 Tax=Saccostrea cuccullata TaxID=36930 RepID=UPI002ED2C556
MCLIYWGDTALKSKNLPYGNADHFWPTSPELLHGYTPNGLAVCKSGAILVCLWNHQVHEQSLGKVIKLTNFGIKFFEIETDKNRPLFTCPTYITENGNEDICVSDVNAVVVTDVGGLLRFRYKGLSDDSQFDPYGICCDSQNNIIIADMMKNRIHMIDENGEFLHYIQYKDMHKPRALCIDEEDNLYVGEWMSYEIKVLSRR